MQQGRVQLDADWNEQAAIQIECLRELGADLIGPCAGPSDNLGYAAFQLFQDSAIAIPFDFGITSGHFYVDGILCENEHDYAAFAIPSNLRNNAVTINPDRLELDGALVQVGDYLELFDPTKRTNSLPAVVTKIAGGAITVATPTNSLSRWGRSAQA